ncbi:hypothetical protein PROFUN_12947 [Planoprotostelium fungivorum]|uniref:USP8 dimerisation domain-containing protein n=1 Tax=Planoprotostelium fungivorum TaxID=1890364 RepID=A0A2P6N5W3_9EUKA|nr:hypothetical protein PROFUN_12947 [Planoprotostelium fungivorum]
MNTHPQQNTSNIRSSIASSTDEVRSSSRGVVVVIINRTKDILLRTDFGLGLGRWKRFPEDEFLYPNQFAVITAESNGVVSGVEGFLEYTKSSNLCENEFIQPLTFQWKVPYVGRNTFDCGEDALRRDAYTIHRAVMLEQNPPQLIFTIYNDTQRATPFTSVITTPSSLTPSSPTSQTHHSTGPVMRESWRNEMQKGGKGVELYIVNHTYKLMERLEYSVNSSGGWRKEPPRFIEPGKVAHFGCDSSTLSILTGHVTYRLLPEDNFVRLMWSVPLVGQRTQSEALRDGLNGVTIDIEHNCSGNLMSWKICTNETEEDPAVLTSQASAIYAERIQSLVLPKMLPQETYIEQKASMNQHSTKSPEPTPHTVTAPNGSHYNVNIVKPSAPASRGPGKLEKLNARGSEGLPNVENSIGLNNYYHLGNQLWDAALSAKRGGDKEGQYVNLMKYTTLVLHKIPRHISYQLGRFDDDRVASRQKCMKALQEMETLQEAFSKEDDAVNMPSFPSVSHIKSNVSRSKDSKGTEGLSAQGVNVL